MYVVDELQLSLYLTHPFTAISNETRTSSSVRYHLVAIGRRLPPEVFCNVRPLYVLDIGPTHMFRFRDPDERPTAAELRCHQYLVLQPDWCFNGFK